MLHRDATDREELNEMGWTPEMRAVAALENARAALEDFEGDFHTESLTARAIDSVEQALEFIGRIELPGGAATFSPEVQAALREFDAGVTEGHRLAREAART
jgi:hypothetical protein